MAKKKRNLMTNQHAKHGRGTEADGPDDPDCECRGTAKEKACAKAGCGFCKASIEFMVKLKHRKHCDDYINDQTQPEVLRKWLEWARSPGHGLMREKPHPELYANVVGGDTVRLTMASRLGSVGWTFNLKQETGYESRGYLSSLTNFRDKP